MKCKQGRKQGICTLLSINIFAKADVENRDGPAFWIDFVYHAIGADTDPPTFSIHKLKGTTGKRHVGQGTDGIADAIVVPPWKPGKFLNGPRQDQQKQGHQDFFSNRAVAFSKGTALLRDAFALS